MHCGGREKGWKVHRVISKIHCCYIHRMTSRIRGQEEKRNGTGKTEGIMWRRESGLARKALHQLNWIAFADHFTVKYHLISFHGILFVSLNLKLFLSVFVYLFFYSINYENIFIFLTFTKICLLKRFFKLNQLRQCAVEGEKINSHICFKIFESSFFYFW